MKYSDLTPEQKRKRRASSRAWQLRNPEKVNAKNREWCAANRERSRAQKRAAMRRRRAVNREWMRSIEREALRRWRAQNKWRVNASQNARYPRIAAQACERQFRLRVQHLSEKDQAICRVLLEFKRWCRANGYTGLKQLLAET